MIAVTRRYRFPAAHILRRRELSQAENERLYGKCANPNGHGHDYGIEVTVGGEPDPVTGWVADPDALDALVGQRVLDRFAHRMLNDDPAFADAVPTAENIARFVHEELQTPVRERTGARLLRVRVLETRRNTFEFGDRT